MRKLAGVIGVAICVFCLPARADTVCPSGAGIFDIVGTWEKYSVVSERYITGFHRRLMNHVGKVAGATSAGDRAALVSASKRLGQDVDVLIHRMWEEGFIAATDSVAAYCIKTPSKSGWNAAIREKRERAYCKTEPTAHFCPKR